MKQLLILAIGILTVFNIAHAQTTPALYCVSTKTFDDGEHWPVNQINIFTNEKGIVKMSLQFHAWGQSEEEDATITTDTLLTLSKIDFDSKTKTLKNNSNKFVLELKEELSPEQANNILNSKNVSFSFEDPAGMLVDFKKYYLAQLTQFSYPGKKDKWSSTLMDAFKAGVNEYVCGDIKDVKERK